MSFCTIRLTGSPCDTLAGAFGVDLRSADATAPDDFAGFGTHGQGIEAGFALARNATRI
jgi:hypothetical protein